MPEDLEQVGTPPDPRFTLANERTFLAWNRTSLGLVALGVAAGQALDYSSQLARLAVALPPILLGATLATLSIARWRRNERAMRLGEPLRLDGPYRLLTAGVVLIATIALAVLIAEAV